MKIIDLIQAYRTTPVFSTKDIEKKFAGFESENLLNWQRAGYLFRVRNGWYGLTEYARSLHDQYFIANKIYSPSYVSLESALSYYGWIPEGVFSVTSVTTLKTQSFHTPIGTFLYRSIKPSLFFGYKIVRKDGIFFKIAEPEKTLLDVFYFRTTIRDLEDLAAMRFNMWEIKNTIDTDKLRAYATLFNSKTLNGKADLLINALNNGEFE